MPTEERIKKKKLCKRIDSVGIERVVFPDGGHIMRPAKEVEIDGPKSRNGRAGLKDGLIQKKRGKADRGCRGARIRSISEEIYRGGRG